MDSALKTMERLQAPTDIHLLKRTYFSIYVGIVQCEPAIILL